MNKKIILLWAIIPIGLAAHADYTVQTYEPFYPQQTGNYYSTQQPYTQTYNQYNQGYYQNPYYNPYQAGYQYGNPYQNPYGYGRSLPSTIINSAVSGIGATNGSSQVVKNIGQSLIYSMLRGY